MEKETEGSKYTIQMNEPMRYAGLTFFQASWGPQGAPPGTPLFSVFEVVRNPADKWPEYSLYVVTIGLLVHFILKLVAAIRSRLDELALVPVVIDEQVQAFL